MRAKISIVGGGIMGTALAARLARRTDCLRDPVVLFERDHLGAGSSGLSGAILRQIYGDRRLALMARDSLRVYSGFELRTGRPIGFTRTGVLSIVGPDQAEWQERLGAILAELREHGIDIRAVDADEMRDLVPGIEVADGALGAFEPDGGFVDPVATVDAFAGLARSRGAVTRLGSPVERVLVENGRAVGVRVDGEDVPSEIVVLTGGPWTGSLLAELGIEIPLRIVVPENAFLAMPREDPCAEEEQPATGLAAFADCLDPFLSVAAVEASPPPGMHPVLIDIERGIYARCEPASVRTRVGRLDYEGDAVIETPEQRPAEPSAELCAWGRERLAGRLPVYEHREDAGGITAWYTLTPDAQPVIGPAPGIEGLFLATGFSGHGFKLAPSVAEGLEEMISGHPVTAFDPELFAPDRFTGNEAWGGQFGL
ncbi:MAG TPA: FAD-binding oxidoreductase [Planctomycetes bacterium]|nr:FAD-binding oxidoreductase [Planctomycetota bacterium]